MEHYFRHEYGRLVAVLVRPVGLRHLETVEDAVQASLLAALTAWVTFGIPDNSGAWLYRVAHNHLLGVLRKDHGHQIILDAAADEGGDNDEHPSSPAFAGEVRDELLRMLFVCCDEDSLRLQHRRDRLPPVHQAACIVSASCRGGAVPRRGSAPLSSVSKTNGISCP